MKKKFKVNKQKNLLFKIGDEAIDYAKSIIPNAGNIVSAIKATKGEALARFCWARETWDDRKDLNKTSYAATLTNGGGCREYSALVYLFLRKKIAQMNHNNLYIAYCNIPENGYRHSFVAITIGQRNELTKDDIVVDAWPPATQSLFFLHHKWHLKKHVIFKIEKPSKKLLLNLKTNSPHEDSVILAKYKKFNFNKYKEMLNNKFPRIINSKKKIFFNVQTLTDNKYGYQGYQYWTEESGIRYRP